MGVWLYANVASGVQEEARKAVEGQLERLRRHAGDQGWEIVGESFDSPPRDGQQRPGFAHVLEVSRSSKFDILLVTTISRVGRDFTRLSVVTDSLRAAGVTIHTLDGPIRFSKRSFTAAPQRLGDVSTSAPEVARAWRRQIVQAGHWPGGRPNFGYRIVRGDDGQCTLALNSSEARVVRRAFELVLYHGPLLHRIARVLNDEGYRTRRGLCWSAAAVAQMLQDPIYSGHLRFRVPLDPNNIEESITGFRISVPPIVARQLFFEVQRTLRLLRRRRLYVARSPRPVPGASNDRRNG